jgi:predicted acetyltransferase
MSQFFDIKDRRSWCEGALKSLQRYSTEDDRHIYILKESETIIGFAFINKHFRFNHDGFAVAEFYIKKDHERKGFGRKLAEHVFAQFSGNWEVAVSKKNHSARVFWKQVVSSYTGGNFVEKRIGSFSGYGFLFNNA